MDIKELGQLSGPPEEHWYYAAKFALLARAVRGVRAERVADIGAGSGLFARLLLQRGVCQEAWCIDPAYAADSDEIVDGKTLHFRRGYGGEKVDLVLLMDVLEHVDDDVGLLRAVTADLAPGTPVFITVPAFAFLWSAHDVFLEHRRRYTRGMLLETILQAGLQPGWVRYFYAAIFPIAALVRLLQRGRDPNAGSDLRPAPRLVAAALRGVLALELRTVFAINRLAGLSVVGMARVKQPSSVKP